MAGVMRALIHDLKQKQFGSTRRAVVSFPRQGGLNMKLPFILLAFSALLSTPVNAATFLVSGDAPGKIFGTVRCETMTFCDVETPYLQSFAFNVFGDETLPIGSVYNFSYGSGPAGYIEGAFKSIGDGAYVGLSLNYERYISNCPMGERECFWIASTSSFAVNQISPPPVPEPSTWATLLLGMFGIAVVLRRRSGRPVLQAV